MNKLLKVLWIFAFVVLLFDLGGVVNPNLSQKDKQTLALLGLVQCAILWFNFDHTWKNKKK